MDFEPYFKVQNLVFVNPKNTILGQMINFNMIFDVVESIGCLPFVIIIRLGRALINGKGFSKITKPTERNGAYHLQVDFPSLFSADERLETGKFCKW